MADVVEVELQPMEVFKGRLLFSEGAEAQADKGKGKAEESDAAGRAVDAGEAELRITNGAVTMTNPSTSVTSVLAFNRITRSFIEGDCFCVEGKWSKGPSLQRLECGAQTALRVQSVLKEAVAARLSQVQAILKDQAARSKAERRRAARGKLVLVVDSNVGHRKQLTKLLQAGGQVAVHCDDCVAALDLYESDPDGIAMILTELHPTDDMSGWQMAREIRHREQGAERKRTMIFALTKMHYDETGVDESTSNKNKRSSNLCHSEQAGMDGYMMKPPTRAKLRALLTQYLSARESVGGATVRGGLMTTAVGDGMTEGGGRYGDSFDEALANFYAKEHWFPKLFLLPTFLTRKFMNMYWRMLACWGIVWGGEFDKPANMIIF